MSSDVNNTENFKPSASEDSELQEALKILEGGTPSPQEKEPVQSETEPTPPTPAPTPATSDPRVDQVLSENQRLQGQLEEMRAMLYGSMAGGQDEPAEPPPLSVLSDDQFEQLTPAQQRKIIKEENRAETQRELEQQIAAIRTNEIAPIRQYLSNRALYDQARGLIDRVGQEEFNRLAPAMSKIADEQKTDNVDLCYKLARADELEQQLNDSKRTSATRQVRAQAEKPSATATATTKMRGQPSEDEQAEEALRDLPPEVRAMLAR